MNRLPVDNSSAHRRPAAEQLELHTAPAESPIIGPYKRRIDITVDAANNSVVCLTEPRGIFRDHIQHRLNIRRRAGDDAQYLARRRLLLQRFLEFLEQPHVLDRDHRLVGEGFE